MKNGLLLKMKKTSVLLGVTCVYWIKEICGRKRTQWKTVHTYLVKVVSGSG